MPPKARAILFDLGETLVTQNIEDSMVTKRALQEISKILPKQIAPATLFRLYMRGYKTNDQIRNEYNVEIPIQAWMRMLLRRAIGSEPTDRLVEKCIRIVVKARAANAIAFSDAQTTLRRLRRKNRKLGIISNVSSHDLANAILAHVKLGQYFDPVVTSALTGIRKPDPGIFRYALYELKMKPAEVVIVGDSQRADIDGGYISGLRTVLIDRKRRADSTLADYQFQSLSEAVPTLESL